MRQFLRYTAITSLVLFIYSGLIKWINFPVDPTILFFIISIASLILIVRYVRFSKPVSITLLCFLVFFLWTGISCFYTLSDGYWKEKLLRSLLSVPSFLFPIILFKKEEDFRTVQSIYCVLLVVGLLLLGYEYFHNNLSRLIANKPEETRIPEYLNISIFLGTGSLLIFSMKNSFKYVIISLSMLFIVLLGARAPIIFLVLSFFLFLFLRGHFARLTFLLCFITLVVIFSSSISFLDRLMNRFSGVPLIGKTIDTSVGSRLHVYQLSLKTIKERPIFGTGLGGFSQAVYGTDEVAVIHNIFLEIWVELGIVGLIILVFFMLSSAINLFNLYNHNTADLIGLSFLCICSFQFLELLVSSKMEDWRVPLFWLGSALSYYSFSVKTSLDSCAE